MLHAPQSDSGGGQRGCPKCFFFGGRSAPFTECIIIFPPASLPSLVDIALKVDIQNSRPFVSIILLLSQRKSEWKTERAFLLMLENSFREMWNTNGVGHTTSFLILWLVHTCSIVAEKLECSKVLCSFNNVMTLFSLKTNSLAVVILA